MQVLLQNELTMLRIRTTTTEMIVTPEKEYYLIAVQKTSHAPDPAWSEAPMHPNLLYHPNDLHCCWNHIMFWTIKNSLFFRGWAFINVHPLSSTQHSYTSIELLVLYKGQATTTQLGYLNGISTLRSLLGFSICFGSEGFSICFRAGHEDQESWNKILPLT